MRRNETGREVAETRGIGLLATVYADEAVVGEVRPLVGRVLDLDPTRLESVDVHSLHTVQRPRVRGLGQYLADPEDAPLRHIALGIDIGRRPFKLAHLYGVECAPSGRARIFYDNALGVCNRLENIDKRGAILVVIAHGHRFEIAGAYQRIAPLVVREELREIALPDRQILKRDRQRARRVGPLPRVIQHRAEIACDTLAARAAVRLSQIRLHGRVVSVEICICGEGDSVDRHRLDGVGVEECPVRAEKASVCRRSRASPAGLDRITAAATARRLHGRVVGVDERLVVREREDDRIAVRNLEARGRGERHRHLRVRDDRVASADSRDRNAVRRHRLELEPRLRGNRQRADRCRRVDRIDRIFATATFAELADLDGVEGSHARRRCGIRDGEVRRCARGREYANDGCAVGIVRAIVCSVDMHWRRTVCRDKRAVGTPMRNKLEEVGSACRQSLKRKDERELPGRGTIAPPVPTTLKHVSEVARHSLVHEVCDHVPRGGRRSRNHNGICEISGTRKGHTTHRSSLYRIRI